MHSRGPAQITMSSLTSCRHGQCFCSGSAKQDPTLPFNAALILQRSGLNYVLLHAGAGQPPHMQAWPVLWLSILKQVCCIASMYCTGYCSVPASDPSHPAGTATVSAWAQQSSQFQVPHRHLELPKVLQRSCLNDNELPGLLQAWLMLLLSLSKAVNFRCCITTLYCIRDCRGAVGVMFGRMLALNSSPISCRHGTRCIRRWPRHAGDETHLRLSFKRRS